MSGYRYSNKRMGARSRSGQFRKMLPVDLGIGGLCDCGHFLLRHYNGDPREEHLDPRKFVYRCFTCNPETPDELALKAEIEAAKPKPISILDILREQRAEQEQAT